MTPLTNKSEARKNYGKPKPRSDGYSTRTIDGNKKLLHHWVWIIYNGKIPKGYDVHHKNKDKSDNRIVNLELLSKLDHKRKHSGVYANKKGVLIKPCNSCNKKKPLETGYYFNRGKNCYAHECKVCVSQRSVSDKRRRK